MMDLRVTALCAIALWALLLPVPVANAQGAAVVRAVEHPEYSRLVIPLRAGADWDVRESRDRAQVRLSGFVGDYDVAGVFDRMPRTRIRSVSVSTTEDATVIDIGLACACVVEAATIGSGFLSIDVRRDQANSASSNPAGSTVGRFLSPQASAPSRAAQPETTDLLVGTRSDAPAENLNREDALAATSAENGGEEGEADTVASDGGEPDAAPSAPDDPVLAARDALLRQLTRAADEGLLTLANDAETSGDDPDDEASGDGNDDSARKGLKTVAEAEAGRVEEGSENKAEEYDRATPDGSSGHSKPKTPDMTTDSMTPGDALLATLTEGGGTARSDLEAHLTIRGPEAPARRSDPEKVDVPKPVCVADRALDASSWARASNDFIRGLAELRRNMVGADGNIDGKAVADLARLYIGAGFGREASSLLAATGGSVRGGDLLADLANVIEGRPPARGGPLEMAQNCEGRVKMWRAAAGLDSFDPDTPEGRRIRDAFEDLPPQLRHLLGHVMAKQSILKGKPEAARAIFDRLERVPGRPPLGSNLVRAALLIAEDRPDAALALTSPAIEEGRGVTPEHLSLHGAALLAAKKGPSAAYVAALDGLLVVTSGDTEQGRDARHLRVRMEAARGRPLQALSALSKLTSGDPADDPELRSIGLDILEGMTPEDRASDTGARTILAHRALLGSDARGQRLRRSFARALVEQGLPNAALDLIEGVTDIADRDKTLLKAAAYRGVADWDAVLQTVDALDGLEATDFALDAHLGRRDLLAGYSTLNAAGSSGERRDTLGFLAGAWGDVAASTVAEPYRTLAAFVQARMSGDGAPDPEETTLAAAERAASQADDLRRALEQMTKPEAATGG